MRLIKIRERIEESWSIDTTYCPEFYDNEDVSFGQCAVTAVLLQDLIGGDLMMGTAYHAESGYETRHYWNRVQGLDIDLTWRQFPVGTKLRAIKVAKREILLKNDWMRQRYETLKKSYEQRVDKL